MDLVIDPKLVNHDSWGVYALGSLADFVPWQYYIILN